MKYIPGHGRRVNQRNKVAIILGSGLMIGCFISAYDDPFQAGGVPGGVRW